MEIDYKDEMTIEKEEKKKKRMKERLIITTKIFLTLWLFFMIVIIPSLLLLAKSLKYFLNPKLTVTSFCNTLSLPPVAFV